MVLKSKKRIDNNPNLICTTKSVFDWEKNNEEYISNRENLKTEANSPVKKTKLTIRGKLLYNENDFNVMLNPRQKKCPYPENGNFLEWDDSKSARSFDKTANFEEKPQKIIKRVNFVLYASHDNPLKLN